MTDFHCEIIRLGPCLKHPNADTLSITNIGAYPVIFRTGDYSEGDLAVYVPEESVVPTTDPRWSFLGGKGRIRAKKLRGIFSCGLLTQIDPTWENVYVGQDVSEKLGITKYLTPQEQNELVQSNGPNRVKAVNICSKYLPRYTDVENLRRHPNAFAPGQTVICTEKAEGESCAYTYNTPSIWQRFKSWIGLNTPNPVLCRSRNQMKTSGKWFEIINKYDLQGKFESLEEPERYSIYGESYGYTKGFDYNTDKSGSFLVFDIWDRVNECWLDYDDTYQVCEEMELEMVPTLYRGPYDLEYLTKMAENPSTIANFTHIQEGLIIRPEYEQNVPGIGRMIFKLKSQNYLLRKD